MLPAHFSLTLGLSNMKHPAIMKAFLQDYLTWVDAGAPDQEPYWRQFGLCQAARMYMKSNNLDFSLTWELELLFIQEDKDTEYPFGHYNYITRANDKTQHEDPIRLDWIKKTIGELPWLYMQDYLSFLEW